MSNYHNNLRDGSRARLATLRAYVAKWNVKPHANLIDWQTARTFGVASIKSEAHGIARPCKDYCSLPASILAGFRDIGDACDIVSRLPSGYYVDDCQDETYAAHVWQLPARNGEPQYVAGYTERDSGYAVLDCSGSDIAIYDGKDDAARAADSLAERNAETEREYSERYTEARMLDDEISETCDALRQARADFSRFFRGYHQAVKLGAKDAACICSERSIAAREAFADLADTLRTLRDRLPDFASVER